MPEEGLAGLLTILRRTLGSRITTLSPSPQQASTRCAHRPQADQPQLGNLRRVPRVLGPNSYKLAPTRQRGHRCCACWSSTVTLSRVLDLRSNTSTASAISSMRQPGHRGQDSQELDAHSSITVLTQLRRY